MKPTVDLAVIGTGHAGRDVAFAVREARWSVAIIDERPFGGTCALRGCDPKKVLVNDAVLRDWVERMQGCGARGDSQIDWAELLRFKRSFTEPAPANFESAFRAVGIEAYHGTARFTDSRILQVDGHFIEPRYVAIVSRAGPAPLKIPGEELLLTSEEFLDLSALPKRILFVGGGYIAFEFAHVAARAGAQAIIVHRRENVLAGFDRQLVSQLLEVTEAIGVDVRLNAEVTGIEKASSGLRVKLRTADGNALVECDLAIHAAGRKPTLSQLHLDAAGIAYREAGISVNVYLQSCTNEFVYAGGDSADGGGLPLTPVAVAEGKLIARNLLEGNRHSMDCSGLASIAYTVPALGKTGLTEPEAIEKGLGFSIREGDTTQWASSRRMRAQRSAFRILIEDQTDRLLGAHVLGPYTEELINIFSLAIRERIPAARLRDVLFAYPTGASDVEFMLA